MRDRIVTVAGKNISVTEKKIGELEKLTAELFPGSKGKIKDIQKALNNLEIDWDLLYDKLPIIFPELTKDDIKNAYMSEIESLVQGFIDVNFFGIKKIANQMMRLIQTSLQQK
ncbi:hypothetical protein FDN13_01365 [Caloramator sp. E03]|uniref:hypothetical protein n=1 Tax=Caloramator sp. E03 TaxID=2576307 RepID=UPI0011106376|nr:hypothetical protein [Caloramator sp. E03]QCX32453.1 hypothetical protein FDN13_01365 [Caloramator sp. E03]